MASMENVEALEREIRACTACSNSFAATATGHAPRPVLLLSATARICICGQAPGVRVHASGIPFDDPSGDRLRSWMGIDRETFYDRTRIAFAPMAFCFPGQDGRGSDLPPPPLCAALWRERILAAMPNVECLILAGAWSQRWHLGREAERNLTETCRNWRRYTPGALPLPHPSWRNNAWLLRNPWFEKDLVPYLRRRVLELLQD